MIGQIFDPARFDLVKYQVKKQTVVRCAHDRVVRAAVVDRAPARARAARGVAMIAYYALVKAVHVGAVLVSGLVFLSRGLLVQAGRERWAQVAPVRFVPLRRRPE